MKSFSLLLYTIGIPQRKVDIMSIKKIAELAGTSPATVSRVLSNPDHHCQTPGLSETIWNIAKELHYLPNTAARELRKGSTSCSSPFSVDIFLTRFDSLDKDPFFHELYVYVQDELQKNGCILGELLSTVDILKSNSVPSPYRIPYKTPELVRSEKRSNSPAFMSRKSNTGLIIFGKCPPELISFIKKRYSYIAGIDRNPTNYEYDEVICSGESAAKTAVEYLISLGHKKIAYIGDCTYESRYIGYYQALLDHQIPLDYDFVHPSTQTESEGVQIMNRIFALSNRPTAIFCANDCTAIGVLKAIKMSKKRGYHPSVISIDNIRESEHTSPLLTTINIPKQQMAHLALMLLLDQRNEEHKDCVRIELPSRLIKRDSCSYLSF